MTTQRFYNPDWIDDDDLVAGFIARRELFAFLRDELKRMPRRGNVQHYLLVGPRGSGKTTLLKRLAVAIRRDGDLADHLIALSFQEELYQLKGLADFWWAACEALSDELDRTGRRKEADLLDEAIDKQKRERPNPRPDPHDGTGLELLLETCEGLQRRPVLLVDNVDMVMQRLDTRGRKRNDPLSPAYWALREALSTADAPIMIGGSVRVSEPFSGYDKAFYDFFATKRMAKLSLEEVEEVLRHLAEAHGMPDWERRVRGQRGRIRALYEMTGGNPRALGLIFDLLRQGSSGKAIDDFERLLDLTTPYYKARMEDLSEQAQVIVHAMAQLRRRVPAADIAREAGLETRTVSSQLDLLVNEGVVEKTPGKKTHYIIAEQMFRIWLQMRSSRRLRQRVQYLTEFLEALYDQEDLDRLLSTDDMLSGRPQTAGLRAYAIAEWQGDTPLAQALRASAAEKLLYGPDGPFQACAPGDFGAGQEALAGCLATLHKHKKRLGSLDPKHVAGSLTLSVQERCDSAARLSVSATAKAERERLETLLGKEQRRLEQAGLSDAEIDLLYELRSNDQWGLPDLTIEDVEATAAVHRAHRAKLYHIAWALLGSRLITVPSAADAQAWVEFGRSHLPDAGCDGWTKVAEALRLADFYDAAVEAIEEALRHGESGQAWFERGVLLARHEDHFEEAEAALRKSIGLSQLKAESWIEIGEILHEKIGKTKEAESAFKNAVSLDPSGFIAWIYMSKILFIKKNDFTRAKLATEKLLIINKNSPHIWNYFGILLGIFLEHFDEAEVALKKSIALDPLMPLSWATLGNLLIEKFGRFEEAEVVLRRATKLDPSAPIPWAQLGKVLATSSKNSEEAEAALHKSIEIDPFEERSWMSLGALLSIHSERYNEAEIAFRKAIALDPSSSDACLMLGALVFFPLQRINDGKEVLRKASLIDSENINISKVYNMFIIQEAIIGVVEAFSEENWGIARGKMEKLLATPENGPELWTRDIMIDNLVGNALRLGKGEGLLCLFRELGVDRLAAPLVMAMEAVLAGSAESLANVEPEARAAAESLYERLLRHQSGEPAQKG